MDAVGNKGQALAEPGRHGRVMWITPDRVFYVGLLGTPSARYFGGITLYVALDRPIRACLDGGQWFSASVVMVPPYTSHQVACESRHVAVIHVEPEGVAVNGLPALLRGAGGPVTDEAFRSHVLRCHQALLDHGRWPEEPAFDFDELMFGQRLVPRTVDPRIARVLDVIRQDPSDPALAEDCARSVHLSVSRFLHLFKREVGTPFRAFRTWKRARSLLYYVDHQHLTLTDVALGAGYPDSTHFSHSIRQFYGLKPRDIFAGSRKLRVIGSMLPMR